MNKISDYHTFGQKIILEIKKNMIEFPKNLFIDITFMEWNEENKFFKRHLNV